MSSPDRYFRIKRNDRVLAVQFDNPPLNFLTSAMMSQLKCLLRELEEDHEVAAVVFTSAIPEVFLVHFDVDEITQVARYLVTPSSPGLAQVVSRAESALAHHLVACTLFERNPAATIAEMSVLYEVCASLRASDKVFIAAINGRAMGAGVVLTLACDIRLMADGYVDENQVVGRREIGLLLGPSGAQMMRSLGVARTWEVRLKSRLLSPKEAHELGLVNRVVSAAELPSEAMALAKRLSRHSLVAIRAIKHAWRSKNLSHSGRQHKR